MTEEEIASVKSQIIEEKDFIVKFQLVEKVGPYLFNKDTKFVLDTTLEILDFSIKNNLKVMESSGYYYLGLMNGFMNSAEESIPYYLKSLQILKEMDTDHSRQAEILNNMGILYWGIGDFDKGLEYTKQSILKSEYLQDDNRIGWGYLALGNYHIDLKDYKQSQEYLENAIPYFVRGTDELGRANCINKLGHIKAQVGEYQQAIQYCEQSLDIYLSLEKANSQYGVSRAYNDLGDIYKKLLKWEQSEEYYKNALKIRRESKNTQAVITTLTDLGQLFLEIGRLDQSLENLLEAKTLADKIQAKAKAYKINLILSEVYEQQFDLEKALNHYKEFYRLKSETLGDESEAKVKNMRAQMEIERTEQETQIYRLKNIELKKAYEEIEEKNTEILDSINYAKRIQEAVLPLLEEIQEALPDSFVFYQPRDIVSGDFYWFAQKEDLYFIAAADCTGHGVPGAFMSMIGDSLLNQIIHDHQIYTPNLILDELHQGILKVLKQGEKANDGMDIALVVIDKKKNIIQFAGANSPMVYIQNRELKMFPGDKFGIGDLYKRQGKTFTLYELPIDVETVFYIFSDGYQDQFGGEARKKLMKPAFRHLLYEMHSETMLKQKINLLNFFKQWKGQLNQIDDVLVIGVRLKANSKK